MTATLHEDLCTFIITSRLILLRMRNISDKSCRQNQNTHFLFNVFLPSRKSCRLRDNVRKYGTAGQATYDNIIQRMRFANWITKATDTHSEYIVHIAFARQHWLRERASTLRLYVHSVSSWEILFKHRCTKSHTLLKPLPVFSTFSVQFG
jgi:hypothetical protein